MLVMQASLEDLEGNLEEELPSEALIFFFPQISLSRSLTQIEFSLVLGRH